MTIKKNRFLNSLNKFKSDLFVFFRNFKINLLVLKPFLNFYYLLNNKFLQFKSL